MRRLAGLTPRMPVLAVALATTAALGAASTQATPTAPPKPPLARTGQVPQIGQETATLKGGVNPRGSETSYYFQYGPTPAYGSQTTPAEAGDGTRELVVTAVVYELLPYTTYHYRVVASSPAGTSVGEDRTFLTKQDPLAFTLASASETHTFGTPLTIDGRLSGTDSANRLLSLEANPFPYLAGFGPSGLQSTTDATGAFSFTLTSPPFNTEFRVGVAGASPSLHSTTVLERTAVRIRLDAAAISKAGTTEIRGDVEPAEPGVYVKIERLWGHHRSEGVGRERLRGKGRRSRFSILLHHAKRGWYRARVQIYDGQQVSGYSRGIHVR